MKIDFNNTSDLDNFKINIYSANGNGAEEDIDVSIVNYEELRCLKVVTKVADVHSLISFKEDIETTELSLKFKNINSSSYVRLPRYKILLSNNRTITHYTECYAQGWSSYLPVADSQGRQAITTNISGIENKTFGNSLINKWHVSKAKIEADTLNIYVDDVLVNSIRVGKGVKIKNISLELAYCWDGGIYKQTSYTDYIEYVENTIDTKVKIDGNWKKVKSVFVKIDGSWKKVKKMVKKIDGSWKG